MKLFKEKDITDESSLTDVKERLESLRHELKQLTNTHSTVCSTTLDMDLMSDRQPSFFMKDIKAREKLSNEISRLEGVEKQLSQIDQTCIVL